MKFSTLQMIAIVCILAVFTTVSLFVLTTEAHDNTLECEAASLFCSAAYTSVMYYCYSGEVYDPDACDVAWQFMGSACANAESICAHDINAEH